MKRALAAVLPIAALLGGCGFHLAGEEPLPPALQSVYIEVVDPYHVTVPPLETALQARILRGGGVVRPKSEQANSVLRLTDLSETQEVLSIGADGQAIEYRLVSRATFELISNHQQLVPPQSQGLDRAYSFSATQILPKEAEAARLSGYIQKDLADIIMLRLVAQLNHPEATGQFVPPPPAPKTPVVPPADGPASPPATPPAATSVPAAPAAAGDAPPAP